MIVFNRRIRVDARSLVPEAFTFRMLSSGVFGLLQRAMGLWGAALLLLPGLGGRLGLWSSGRRLWLTVLLTSGLLPSRQATMQGLHKMEGQPQVDTWDACLPGSGYRLQSKS